MKVTVLVGTRKGAFFLHSDGDRGDWRLEGPVFKGWKVTAATRGPEGDVVLATASDVYGCAIHRGHGDGDAASWGQWRQVGGAPKYDEDSGFKLESVWRMVTAGDRLIACVSEAGLFESRDGGENWSLMEGLSSLESRRRWYPGAGGLCAHALLVDPARPERMWVGISAVGVFRTEDGGGTWVACNRGVPVIIEDRKVKDIGCCVHGLALDPSSPDRLFRQDHRGVFRSEDAGDTWVRTEEGLPSTFGFPMVHVPSTGALYVVPLESDEYRVPKGGRLQVYRSVDRGSSWQPAGEPLGGTNWNSVLRASMACDGLEEPGLYVGTTGGEVYTSLDGGDHWTRIGGGLPRILCVETFVEA